MMCKSWQEVESGAWESREYGGPGNSMCVNCEGGTWTYVPTEESQCGCSKQEDKD